MKKLNLLLTSSLLFGVGSCGLFEKEKTASKSSPSPEIKKIFVHGDPDRMMLGATMNKKSIFQITELEKFNDFHFLGGSLFIEKDEQEEQKTYDEIEDENSTDDTTLEDIFSLNRFNFEKIDDGRYVFKGTIGTSAIEIGFKVVGEFIELADLDGTPVTVMHYSLKNDGRAFSLTLKLPHDEDNGESILVLRFGDSSVINPIPKGVSDYAFLFGSIPIKHEKPILELDICGQYKENEVQSIRNSLQAWTIATEDRFSTSVSLTEKTSYPPFSDMNTNCIMLINGFRLESSPYSYVAGVNYPVINFAEKTIIDSDVFIFTQHVKIPENGEAEETIVHELGHYFGLGHEFKEAEHGGPMYPSVMAYEHSTGFVTSRDKGLMDVLYPDGLLLK